ncbi:hypothetical protein BC939DRAFT_450501, partial [Gamsiella multidivaricata]|uniref:uncharacterized protein n=1 Tax=Gamsiella multidivaricata TaxID=101098 RepID=UPI002220FE45
MDNANASTSAHSISTPSHGTDPLAIPEILSNVFVLFDRHTLQVCARVSRFWRSHALALAWKSLNISNDFFFAAFQEPEKYKETLTQDRELSKFFDNCSQLRSLNIVSNSKDAQRWPVSTMYKGGFGKTAYRHPPGLDNLERFCISQRQLQSFLHQKTELLYDLAASLVARNPGIRDLEVLYQVWQDDARDRKEDCLLKLLSKTGGALRRLSVSSTFEGQDIRLWEYLIQAHSDYQRCHNSDPSDKDPNEHCKSALPCMEHGPYSLDELILEDNSILWSDEIGQLDLTALNTISGTLSIRSLTIIGFETATECPGSSNNIEQLATLLPDSSILAILRHCPNLERLSVSYNLGGLPVEGSFGTQVRELVQHRSSAGHYWWIPERDNFVTEMFRLCPKLTTIDLGMMYELTTEHWVEMMELYGPKLQSLSVWCAINFSSDALTTLIGPPIDHPSRALNGPSAMHCLTQLDINGLAMAHSAAPLVLRNLAALTHFFARDVPMDATQLIGFDWACTKLEVLHICVVLCQERQPKGKEWSWDDESGEWTTALQRRRKQQEHAVGHKREREVMQPLNVDSAENAEGNKNQPQNEMEAEAEAKRRRVEKQAKHENAAEEHGQELSGLQGQGSQSAAENSELTTETRLQIQICKQLGRLTKLRQLVLEGDKGHMDSTGCLQLTMQTGLSYLQPLQQSLETLILYRLDEQLSGRAEVDWIARNWIHHHNKRWLHAHPPLEYNQDEDEDFDSDEDEESDDSEEWADFDPSCHEPPEEDTLIYATERVNIRGASDKSEEDDDKSLYTCPPKFKQLLGVSVRDQRYSVKTAVANLTWLKNQWPSLVLTKKRKPISRNYYDSDESYS